jgi:glycosyltransferase involved in cell wall biosynthesis
VHPTSAETAELSSARAVPSGGALPLISVVTPSFNQGRFLEQCIRSVLDQDYPHFEHIVYDNCSSDETHAILRRYPHIDWVSEPDRGQSDALNKAIRRSHGEIIAWINADDYYAPGAFELGARELHRTAGVQAIAGRVQVVDAAGRVMQTMTPEFHGLDYLLDYWSHHYGLYQPGVLFRRDVFERIGELRVELHCAMDYDFWLRVAERYAIKTVPATLACFRLHEASKSGQAPHFSHFHREMERVSRRYWGPRLSRRRWRLRAGCNGHTADLLVHAILASHRHDQRLNRRLVAELLVRRPLAILNRHVLAALGERLCGPRLWTAAKSALGYGPPRGPAA